MYSKVQYFFVGNQKHLFIMSFFGIKVCVFLENDKTDLSNFFLRF